MKLREHTRMMQFGIMGIFSVFISVHQWFVSKDELAVIGHDFETQLLIDVDGSLVDRLNGQGDIIVVLQQVPAYDCVYGFTKTLAAGFGMGAVVAEG